jgi:hypothetical protein
MYTQAEYDARVDQVTDWLKGASQGNYIARAHLKEAIATSDFPSIFTDIKNAQLQAAYADTRENYQGVWTKIARRLTVPNFLPQSFYEFGIDGDYGVGNLLANNGGKRTTPGTLPNVPEGTEYPTGAFKMYQSQEAMEISKNGARIPFTFEAIINDQWNLVDTLPQYLLKVALDSEDAEVTKLLTDGDGPADRFVDADLNGNLLRYGTNTAGTVALTRDTLKAALYQAQKFKVGENKNLPVRFQNFSVVIPPALEELANDILAAPRQFIVNDGNLQYTDTFSFGNNFSFVVDPWLEVIDQTHGDTAWYVVPAGGEGQRTGLGLGFLQGYDRPELRIHNDQGLLLGGGAVPARAGSFLNDTWELRIRHIYGGAALSGGIGQVVSNGSAAPTV